MKLKELAEGIGKRLGERFPGKLMYVDKIPAEADGNFSLQIIGHRAKSGISARKSRSFNFDVMYFSSADDKYDFLEWSDAMHEALGAFEAGGQLVRAINRAARSEDMVYHFLFEINVEYVEYEPGETMLNLEVETYEEN